MATLNRKMFTHGAFKGTAMQGRHYIASVTGGPELARKLLELERAVFIEATTAGLDKMGAVLGQEWSERVPILDENYRRSIGVKSRATKFGRSGFVGPQNTKGLAERDQPMQYSARLEFGGAGIPAQPSARPAYDAAADRAVEDAVDVMREIVMRVAE